MSSPRVGTVLVALVLAGCAAATPSQLPASPAITVTPSLTASPSVIPTAAPSPLPTVAPACAPGPLTVAQFLAADARCYLTGSVSVAGWWGALRTDEPGQGMSLNWALRGWMPFGAWSQGPEELLFVDEVSIARTPGWPDGIHWATVSGRRSVPDKRACHRDQGADVSAPPHCPSYLVASAVVESEAPQSALAACSTLPTNGESWVDVYAFTAYPPACFGSRDTTVRGWFDIRYIITGWEDPWGISPGWLWVPIGPWTVVAPTSNPDTSEALLVYADPARGVDVSRTNRWVQLTGHYADPKAATCRITGSSAIPDAYARRTCEVHFVLTAIHDTSP